MAEKMYYANKFNLALGNIKRPEILLKTLHWDGITPTANPLLILKLIITLLLIVISWQINLIHFSQMLAQSLQINFQNHMVIFQTT